MNERLTEVNASAEKAQSNLLSVHNQEVDQLVIQTPGAAQEIEILQQRKEAILAELQVDLERLAAEGEVGDAQTMRRVTFNSSRKQLMVYDAAGRQERVRSGTITVSATMWGDSYYMGTEVPEDTKRGYLLDRARYRVDELYDQQIASAEIVRWDTLNEGRSDAYAMVREHFEHPETLEDGHLAEKMVESFLTKLALDFDVPYEIESVNVVDDIEYKIDFVLRPKQTDGAVAVGVVDAPEIGIQFTTAKDKARIEHKKAQIKQAKDAVGRSETHHVQDIILVEMPLKNVRKTYDAWQNTSPHLRAPGGPDELWDIATKGQVYVGTLKQLIERKEVSKSEAIAAWNKFQSASV